MTMKSIYIFSGIIGVVIVATGVIWYVSTRNTETAVSENPVILGSTEQTDTDLVAADGSFSGSVFDLGKTGKSYECTVSHTVQGINSNGVVYITGDNIRANFTSSVPVIGSVKTQMIATTDSVYTWTSLMNQGFKSERGVAKIQAQGQVQSIDLNQTLNYTCKNWTTDMSVFTVPTNITFKSV